MMSDLYNIEKNVLDFDQECINLCNQRFLQEKIDLSSWEVQGVLYTDEDFSLVAYKHRHKDDVVYLKAIHRSHTQEYYAVPIVIKNNKWEPAASINAAVLKGDKQ